MISKFSLKRLFLFEKSLNHVEMNAINSLISKINSAFHYIIIPNTLYQLTYKVGKYQANKIGYELFDSCNNCLIFIATFKIDIFRHFDKTIILCIDRRENEANF